MILALIGAQPILFAKAIRNTAISGFIGPYLGTADLETGGQYITIKTPDQISPLWAKPKPKGRTGWLALMPLFKITRPRYSAIAHQCRNRKIAWYEPGGV